MQNPSKKKLFGFQKKTILWYVYIIILIPICFEIALRIISAKPYIQEDYQIQSVPEKPFLGDDSLAIILKPGVYNITLNKKHTFVATHTKKGFRKVSFLNSSDSIQPKIAMLGCSFTYGFGVNDDEHFTSILQKKHQQYQFINYGVIGYGTTHSYLQLQKLDKQKEFPKMVVLNFATDHFNRNILNNYYRRALKIGFNRSLGASKSVMEKAKYPYILNSDLEIGYENWSEIYKDWKGRSTFSSINWLQTTKDKIEDNTKKDVELSVTLMLEMNAICKKNNAKFIVNLLDKNTKSEFLKSMLTKNSIDFLTVDFNFKNKRLTNYPYDNHPNKKGHQLIADKINNKLKTLLNNE